MCFIFFILDIVTGVMQIILVFFFQNWMNIYVFRKYSIILASSGRNGFLGQTLRCCGILTRGATSKVITPLESSIQELHFLFFKFKIEPLLSILELFENFCLI